MLNLAFSFAQHEEHRAMGKLVLGCLDLRMASRAESRPPSLAGSPVQTAANPGSRMRRFL